MGQISQNKFPTLVVSLIWTPASY